MNYTSYPFNAKSIINHMIASDLFNTKIWRCNASLHRLQHLPLLCMGTEHKPGVSSLTSTGKPENIGVSS